MDPHSLAQELENLSGQYSALTEESGAIEMRRAFAWSEIRAGVKTNTEADHLYDQTADGQRRIYLDHLLKGMEKRMSSLKAVLRQAELEARNLH